MNRDLHAAEIVGALTFLPLILFGIWALIREKRKAAALEAAALSFGPQDDAPSPHSKLCARFLRRFDPPQRAYLRRQRPGLLFVLFMLGWLYFVCFSSGLMPGYVSGYAAQQALPLRAWYSYLFHIPSGAITYVIFALLAAAMASSELGFSLSGSGRFLRTRPLSRSFVFWTHIGSTLSALISSVVLAAAASFILLLLVYGPVWKHLDHGAEPAAAVIANARSQPAPSADDILGSVHSGAGHFTWALQTSVPRLFLSIITTQTLVFSLAIVLASLSIGLGRKRAILTIVSFYALLGLYFFYIVDGSGGSSDLARTCFFYVRPGPPPPYVFALVPITVSAALLGLAGSFSNRREN